MSDDYRKGYADGYAKAEAELIELKVLYSKHLSGLKQMHADLTRMTRLIWNSEQADVKVSLQ
jgi:hypothetical protein